jgi:transposase
MTAMIRSAVSVNESVLFVAFELGKKSWKLALTTGLAVTPWVRTVAAGDLTALDAVLQRARARFGLAATVRVITCYEAGRDGFWIHRAVVTRGFENRVVDSSSIEVNRRKRRAKSDRLDAVKLVLLLARVCAGDRTAWSEVRVPSIAEEAARQRSRERTALTKEQTRLKNQIGSWLATAGARVSSRVREHAAWWRSARDWAGASLSAPLQARIARATERLTQLEEQITTIEAEQAEAMRAAAPDSAAARLRQVKGLGVTSVAVLLDEGLVWRDFKNRRQLGGLLGFAPIKYESGDLSRDQGISRAGNDRLQSTMVQLAWGWVQWQPQSALTRWYLARFGIGKRTRKVGIVALARKLFIALWRYATAGIVPDGAILRPV